MAEKMPQPRSRPVATVFAPISLRLPLIVLSPIFATLLAPARPAAAQACCAGGALVSPTRLAPYEDYGVGLQLRARTNPGSFGTDGEFRWSTGSDQVLQQDLAASLRLTRRAQLGVVIPVLQTHRSAAGLDEWGGGLGDLSLTARHDFFLAAETLYWPGFAVLAGATIPTGTPVDRATRPLATDVTGGGAYELTLGAAIEKVSGHGYAGLNVWGTHRFTRTVANHGQPAITQSFSLRWTVLAVIGYVFDSEAGLAFYASLLDEGAAAVNDVTDPASSLRVTTVGAAGALPLAKSWKLQTSIFTDVMLSSFGRNGPAGFGMTASVVRVWM
jgi:hypothetical protein